MLPADSAEVLRQLLEGWRIFGAALLVTGQVAFGAVLIGLVLGFLGSLCLVFGSRAVRLPVRAYVYAIRGVPPLVALFFIYYGLGVVVVGMSATIAAVAALSLFATAQLAEVFRGAIEAIPRGQSEAAKAIGLPFVSRLAWVLLPQATLRALPSIINTSVDMVKASTLVAAIGVADLLLAAQEFGARTFLIVEVYLVCWSLYLAINFGLSSFGRWLEARTRYVTQ